MGAGVFSTGSEKGGVKNSEKYFVLFYLIFLVPAYYIMDMKILRVVEVGRSANRCRDFIIL